MSASPPAPQPVDAAAFRADGYVLVRRLVGPRTLRSLARAIDALLEKARGLTADAVIDGTKYQVQSATGRPEDGAVAPGALRKITFPSTRNGTFARFAHDARVLAVAERLGVSRPRCAVDQVNLKAPRVGTRFPWHHDAAFLGWRDREAIERHGGVNVLVAVDPADAANGAFEVLPGSHRDGPRPFDYDLGAAGDGDIDARDRVVLAMEPGDAVFFHPHLLHGSGPNPTDRPRRMVALWLVGQQPVHVAPDGGESPPGTPRGASNRGP